MLVLGFTYTHIARSSESTILQIRYGMEFCFVCFFFFRTRSAQQAINTRHNQHTLLCEGHQGFVEQVGGLGKENVGSVYRHFYVEIHYRVSTLYVREIRNRP